MYIYLTVSRNDERRHVMRLSHVLLFLFLSYWKENLNSDGQQFHQYQQNKQFISHLYSLNTKKRHNVGNLGLGLGQAQKCGLVKPVNVIPALPSW